MGKKNKKIKKLLTKGVAGVPTIMQMENLECGAAALAMVMAYFDKWVPLEQVRIDCGVSRDGSNAKNMLIAARSYGFSAQGFRYELEDLKTHGKFPCIIHWSFNHFVVLAGFKGDKAVLNDPAKGCYTVPMSVLDEAFTGICLIIEPGEDFVPGGKPKSIISFTKRRLRGASSAVAFVTLSTLVATLLSIIKPGFSRIFMDRILTDTNPEWFYPFLGALALITLISIVSSAVGVLFTNKIRAKLAAVGNITFFWKLLRLPIAFFTQRTTGDLQNRQVTNSDVANTLVNTVAPLFLNSIMMIFYLIVMLRYSIILTLIGISAILIDTLVSSHISRRRINLTRVKMRDVGKLSSTTAAGIEMIETIKSSGAENSFFKRWSAYQANVNAHEVKELETEQRFGFVSAAASLIANTLITVLGVYFAINGSFTIGMIMAFQGFLSSFMTPAGELLFAGQTIAEMRTSMERIDDVMEYPEDPCYDSENISTDSDPFAKLRGNIELKNVTFGYSPLAEPVIKDFSLTIRERSRVAIVGGSGCGKSTISKLISGLYQPRSGEILFDGKPIREIDRSIFTGSLAIVDQEIVLFEDTIANNIRMWDKTIEDFEIIMAARDAGIHEEIMHREGGYQYVMCENGDDFSGGERQRIEIARVLAQDPSVVILDEATSALDAKTEYEVVNAIKARGITCIIVAHRLSTIRDCDEIIVLDDGKIVERGTHEELFARGGKYTELVTND